MYYLLGYRLFEEYQDTLTKKSSNCSINVPSNGPSNVSDVTKTENTGNKSAAESGNKVSDQNFIPAKTRSALVKAQATFGYFAKSEILNNMDENIISKVSMNVT